MPTQKQRFSVAIDDDLLQGVDDYKFGRRVKSQNQAINDLLRAGIQELKRRDAEEIKKASASAKADTEAVGTKTVNALKEVLGSAGLLDKNQELSDNDLQFLSAMFLAMKAHFNESKEGRD